MLTFHEAEWVRGEHIEEAVGGSRSGTWQCWVYFASLGVFFLAMEGRRQTPHCAPSILQALIWGFLEKDHMDSSPTFQIFRESWPSFLSFPQKTCIFWQDRRLIKYFEFWLEAKKGPGWIPLKYFINCVSSEIFLLPSTFLRCCA